MNFTSALPIFAEATLFVALIVAISLAVYGLTRWGLGRFSTEDTKDISGSVLFRIASLHSLWWPSFLPKNLKALQTSSSLAGEEATLPQ